MKITGLTNQPTNIPIKLMISNIPSVLLSLPIISEIAFKNSFNFDNPFGFSTRLYHFSDLILKILILFCFVCLHYLIPAIRFDYKLPLPPSVVKRIEVCLILRINR